MASPMVLMSRAIRRCIQDNADAATPELRGCSTETLKEFHQILTAFQMDIADELSRRAVASQAPPPKEPDV